MGARPWFRVKRYGFGAGLPCAWQGWAVLLAYCGAMVLLARTMLTPEGRPLAFWLGAGALSVLLVLIAWRRSDKPWRWRWGGDD